MRTYTSARKGSTYAGPFLCPHQRELLCAYMFSPQVAETFNEMIFAHGYVHCDPHAANMLVRKVVSRGVALCRRCMAAAPLRCRPCSVEEAVPYALGLKGAPLRPPHLYAPCAQATSPRNKQREQQQQIEMKPLAMHAAPVNIMHVHAPPFPFPQAGGPQLVLLDHGLYKEISDAFRLEYAGLWRSLIFADEEGIRRHSAAMNAGAAYDVFASMLTQRPWDQVGTEAGQETFRSLH